MEQETWKESIWRGSVLSVWIWSGRVWSEQGGEGVNLKHSVGRLWIMSIKSGREWNGMEWIRGRGVGGCGVVGCGGGGCGVVGCGVGGHGVGGCGVESFEVGSCDARGC